SAKSADKLDIVAFELDGALYGSEIGYVEEVVKPHEITFLPHLPDFVMGIISLRGEMIITLDLKTRLGLPSPCMEFARMLIVESRGFKVALTVDRMAGIRDVSARLEPVIEEETEEGLRYVKGLTSDDGLVIKVLDMNKLIDSRSLAGTGTDG
ncbi:MAG: purine-binding chemotaxis protein CheW, partial [Deltaproteobacteria bacterium]|nr:purine-binding chemotaxis protein CheW [Deltaproteobacteria bacterium]